MAKILFILKERLYSQAKASYGLINSATHVARFLEKHGYECKIVQVVDANCIDREVFIYKPDLVVIEALWVPTYKLHELLHIKRYRHIKWLVRVHSDLAFLSVETQGLKLINEYIALEHPRLTISLNNKEFSKHLTDAWDYKFTFLPNVVPLEHNIPTSKDHHYQMHVGCFGAMRILKNQCFQAICAMNAADKLDKILYFHISPNLNIKIDPVLANLQELFAKTKHHLVIHDWMLQEDFHKLIQNMDFGMQVSFTESFNIVTADFVNNNKLIIVSDAISWMPDKFKVSTVNYDAVIKKIMWAYANRNSWWLKRQGKSALAKYNIQAGIRWLAFLKTHI